MLRLLRNDAEPARAGGQLDPVQRHIPSLFMNVTSSLFLDARLPCV